MFKKLLVVVSLVCFTHSAQAEAEIGKLAPSLIVKQLDGQTFSLADQRGKVVVVNFWATWCPPCREEIPMLNALYKKFHDKGLVIFGVNADRARQRDRVVSAMKGMEYQSGMVGDAVSNNFGWMGSLPVTFLIDRKGMVRNKILPDEMPITEKGLSNLLEPLLMQ